MSEYQFFKSQKQRNFYFFIFLFITRMEPQAMTDKYIQGYLEPLSGVINSLQCTFSVKTNFIQRFPQQRQENNGKGKETKKNTVVQDHLFVLKIVFI